MTRTELIQSFEGIAYDGWSGWTHFWLGTGIAVVIFTCFILFINHTWNNMPKWLENTLAGSLLIASVLVFIYGFMSGFVTGVQNDREIVAKKEKWHETIYADYLKTNFERKEAELVEYDIEITSASNYRGGLVYIGGHPKHFVSMLIAFDEKDDNLDRVETIAGKIIVQRDVPENKEEFVDYYIVEDKKFDELGISTGFVNMIVHTKKSTKLEKIN